MAEREAHYNVFQPHLFGADTDPSPTRHRSHERSPRAGMMLGDGAAEPLIFNQQLSPASLDEQTSSPTQDALLKIKFSYWHRKRQLKPRLTPPKDSIEGRRIGFDRTIDAASNRHSWKFSAQCRP